MTEKEKARRGLLYYAGDPELDAERMACKVLCHQFNQLHPTHYAEREALLRRLLGSVKDTFWIEPTFWCDYGYNISLGDHFYANHNCVILDCAPVTFGEHVLLGPQCGLYTANHPLEAGPRKDGLETARPIAIGDHVWMGGNVTVLPGVTIGDRSIIGAGSVVTGDIPPDVLAVGVPCRPVRTLEAGERDRD